MEFIIRIPRWKAYLYTLNQRIRLFKWLNANWVKLNLNRDEYPLLRSMFKNYVPKEVMRKARVYRYESLIEEVLVKNLSIATKEEIELAMRLSWVKFINTEDLIMEMKQLKEFGKEVGLKPLTMGKMPEDTLIVEILKNVDPKSEYSQEFIAWYDNLGDNYFDAAETIDVDPAPPIDLEEKVESEVGEDDLSELIEVIKESTKAADLKEIAKDDDFAHIFESLDLSKFRAATTLSKAMLECIDSIGSSGGDTVEVDDDTKAEMINIINEIKTEDELIEFVSDETVEAIFSDKLEIGDEIDVDGLKVQMLNLLGFEPEEEVAEAKPMTLKERMAAKKADAAKTKVTKKTGDDGYVVPFDPDAFNIDEVYAASEALPIPQLRKFAKQLEITAPPGSKKTDILDLVADKLTELAEGGGVVEDSTGEDEVTVTKSMVNDAIAADDKDTLIAMCEGFEIKLNALQKKSTKLMGNKLLEVVPDDAPAKRDLSKGKLTSKLKAKDTTAPASETKSIYQTVEEMVLNGDDEKAITAVIKPLYAEKGKTLLHVKKRVKQLVEIIKGDNS